MKSSPPRVDPNCGSALPVVALGLLAVVAGAFHGNALAIAFGVPVAAGPVVLWVLLRLSLDRLEVERVLPDAVFEGETVEVVVRLHNRFAIPLFYPLVTDNFTPEIQSRKRVFFPFRVLPHETVEGRYRGKCLLPRGIYVLDAAVVSVSDPFGWIQLTRRLPERRRLKVYPRVQDFGIADRLGAVVASLRDDHTCPRRGDSLEFFAVREYQRGDPLRRIHWPLTAHRGYPVVREFARNSIGDLAIFLDLYRPALIGVGRGSSLEHAVRMTVALARSALSRGLRVAVYAHGARPHAVASGGGSRHLARVLDLAAVVRPNGDVPLEAVLAEREPALRRGDCAFFTASPYLYRSAELLDRVRRLRARGARVVTAVFDDSSFRALWHGEHPAPGERMAFSAKLAALGVEVHTVACGTDLGRVFARSRGGLR